MADRKKFLFVALLAVMAVAGFSLLISKWEREYATDESQSYSNLVTRVGVAANQAAEKFKGGSTT